MDDRPGERQRRGPVEIGDLAVPFAFAERAGARGDIYTKKLLRHSLVAGHGSWIYWQRSNAVGPYLVMTPSGAAKFEYLRQLAAAPSRHTCMRRRRAPRSRAAGGNWRLPVSSLTLAPKGRRSDVTYTFRFQWAKDFAGVRERPRSGKESSTRTIAPGMVVPVDLPATFSLRTQERRSRAIVPEHPAATRSSAARAAEARASIA